MTKRTSGVLRGCRRKRLLPGRRAGRLAAGLVAVMLLAAFGSAAPCAAQGGKIAGRVVDAAGGQPMPGATVVLEGTTQGAAAGPDGYYTILNVQPSSYTVVASIVGYATTRIENVEVSVDRTTEVDFEMQEQVYEGEEVVVQAERPLVEKGRTTSASYMDAESISNLPVQEVSDLLQMQSGVAYDAAGRLHLRGGRAGEVAYMINGIPVTDQFAGGSKIAIENSWIQEMQVISGTFNAEYGQAQSGVINVVTKEGATETYSGQLSSFVGSYLTAHEDVFSSAGGADLDEYNVQGNLSGPLGLLPSGSFFLSTRYYRSGGWLYGQRRVRIEDTVPIQSYIHEAQQNASDRETLVGIRVPDSLMTGDGSFVAMNPDRKLSLHGNVAFRPFQSVKISYSGFYSDREWKNYSDVRRFAPDGQLTHYEQGMNHILSATHTLTPNTFYNLGLSYQTNTSKAYLFDEVADARYQGSPYSDNGFYFGGTSNGHSRSAQRMLLAKLDLTSQVNQHNLVKVGGSWTRHHIENRYVRVVSDGPVYEAPQLRVPARNTANNDFYEQRPYEGVAYVQDKVEIDEVVVNAGLRFDYWDPNAQVPADLEAITNPEDGIRLQTELVDAGTSMQLSPRLGLAFPISEAGVLHVSYGHFFQVPRFSYVFSNSEYEVELGNLETIMGNANLKPERTVAYEIGLQQGLTDRWKVEMTVYYKDIKNLLGQEIITTKDKKIYARYINRDYGNTKGFVASLIKQYSNNFAATIDYTYQVARGNASDPNSVFYANQTQPPEEPEKQVLPLNWDQRHALNGTLMLGRSDGWMLSVIGRFVTGQPYTPSNPGSQLTAQLENSERKPSRLTLDLNLSNRFDFMGQRVRFFAKGYNVLDALNPRSVYSSTGTPEHPYRTLGEMEVLRQNPNFTADQIDLRPDFYATPRRVIVGIDVSF